MRDMTDNQFKQLAVTRMGQMREWKAIPESKRPTWEEFKRGFKVKKIRFKG
jgi:preprotein translocase subunit Sss1